MANNGQEGEKGAIKVPQEPRMTKKCQMGAKTGQKREKGGKGE